jgi:hypothetical protein
VPSFGAQEIESGSGEIVGDNYLHGEVCGVVYRLRLKRRLYLSAVDGTEDRRPGIDDINSVTLAQR